MRLDLGSALFSTMGICPKIASPPHRYAFGLPGCRALQAIVAHIQAHQSLGRDLSPNNVTTPARTIMDATNCGYPLWSNEGWKDGHMAASTPTGDPMFSYDIFNSLVDYLGDPTAFPNLRNITLFGFSAGAQVGVV